MTTTVSKTEQIQGFLAEHKSIIESFLQDLLPSAQCHHSLFEAMKYSVLNDGKRLRPALVYATGQALNVPIEALHAPAASLELVHCYSLVHDDLPAMDDDDLRRGKPTCHKAYTEATAILVGDALQSLAFEVLTNSMLNPAIGQKQAEMVAVLAKAIGANGMVLGQAEDIAAEHRILELSELMDLHAHKTGALFKACIQLAVLASNCEDKKLINQLILFSEYIGLAFQIQDDILDVVGTDASLGKPAGSDQKHEKSTFTSLLGLDVAQSKAKEFNEKALQAIAPLGEQGSTLRKLANFMIERSY